MSFQPGKPPSPAPPSLLPLTLTAASALPSHTLLPGTVGGVREQCPGVTRLQSPETHSQSGRQEVAAGLEGTGRPQALLPDDSTPSLGGPDSGRSPLCEGGTRGRTRRTRQVRTVTLGQSAGGTQLRLSCDPWDQRRGGRTRGEGGSYGPRGRVARNRPLAVPPPASEGLPGAMVAWVPIALYPSSDPKCA